MDGGGTFPGGNEADISPPSRAKVKNIGAIFPLLFSLHIFATA
jgi:hypothetical protein